MEYRNVDLLLKNFKNLMVARLFAAMWVKLAEIAMGSSLNKERQKRFELSTLSLGS